MLERILKDIQNPIRITISKNNLTRELIKLIKKLNKINKKIEYSIDELDEFSKIECNDSKIIYQALPINLEEFASLIKIISNKETSLKRVKEIKMLSGNLIVFVSPFCPHCSKIIKKAVEFAIVNPKITVKIVDAIQFKELSKEFNIVSVPTLIINEKTKLSGEIHENDIIDALKEDKYYEYKIGYYAYMLKEGYADELKKDIKTKSDVKIIGDLLTHPMLKVRIGAMVLLEKIYKDDPELVEKAKVKIRELLKHGDSRVKEDAALILGKIGDESDIKLLKELLTNENKDVRDSAIEAIEEIEKRIKER